LGPKACEQLCALNEKEQHFLQQAMGKLKLSARGYHRLLKVARTIADMDNKETVELKHFAAGPIFQADATNATIEHSCR
jgi:magnesium chelatase family protein